MIAPKTFYRNSKENTASMVPVAVEPDGIYPELKSFDHWVVWKAVPKEDGGIDKVPYNARTGKKASTTDSRTWSTFDDVVAAYVRDGWDGIGFVLCSGDPYTFVDLDDCRNPENGEIEGWAQEWINHFNGYTEVSPSEAGLHILVRGKSPHNGKRTLRGKKVEVYSTERYLTITGVRP